MSTLYVSDLDGTLLGSDGRPSEFTANTINSLIEKGMNFTFATARSASSASKIIPFFHLKIPAVMMNGVFLTDISSGLQKHVCNMERKTAEAVIDVFLKHARPPIVYTFDSHIDAQYTVVKNEYEKNFIAARQKLYHKFCQTDAYDVKNGAVFVNGIDDKEIIDGIAEELRSVDGIEFSTYLDIYSGDRYFIEVYSEQAGKWNAIKRLKQMYGFDRVVAFGDNGNDVDMMKNADLAVAVGNAQRPALAVADQIVDWNDNDGVAKFLLEEYKEGRL